MKLAEFKKYCLAKKGVQETYPFDARTVVFKVAGKMFALANRENFVSINLKCETERALALRIRHREIQPGYHMNKRHWNTVSLEGALKGDFVKQLIDESYDLVVAGMPRKQRIELGAEEHPTVTRQKAAVKKTKKVVKKKPAPKKKLALKKKPAAKKKSRSKKKAAAKKKSTVQKKTGARRG